MVGTKSEMVKLIKDSGILGKETKKLTLKNFDQKVSFDMIVKAIHKVQDNMGITGTTAKEAEHTISGSFASMKASFENLLVAMADGNGDVDKAMKEFTDSVKTYLENLIPVVLNTLKSLLKVFGQELPNMLEQISDMVTENVDSIDWQGIFDACMDALSRIDWSGLIRAIIKGIVSVRGGIIRAIFTLLGQALEEAINMVQQGAEAGGGNIAYGILYGIGKVFTNIFDWVKSTIFQPFIDAFCKVFGINSPSTVMIKMGGYIVDGFRLGLKGIWSAVTGIITMLKNNIGSAFNQIKSKVVSVMNGMKNAIKNIFSSLWNNIKGAINSILSGVERMANGVVRGINAVINSLNKLNVDLPNGKHFGFNIPNVSEVSIPRLRTGTDYVPDDMFAILHKGESVIPKKFNNAQGFSQMLADAVSSQNFMRVFGNSGMTLVATINVEGVVNMDSRKVGQMVAPSVAKTIKVGGIA